MIFLFQDITPYKGFYFLVCTIVMQQSISLSKDKWHQMVIQWYFEIHLLTEIQVSWFMFLIHFGTFL